MEEHQILDESESEMNESTILHALIWWEKKRLYFNFFVGGAGLLGLIQFFNVLIPVDFIGIIFWGLLANLFYSVGFLLEVFNIYYFRKKIPFYKVRPLLLVMGTLAVSVVTFIVAYLYVYLAIVPF